MPVEQPSKRRFVFGALVVLLLAVVGASAAIIGAGPMAPVAEPSPATSAASAEAGQDVSVSKLEVGDCFDFKDKNAESVAVVLAKDCADGHQFEVFAILQFSDGAYPGLEWIESSATARCQPALEDYTGEAYGESTIDYSWIYPDEAAWAADDRVVHCFAYVSGNSALTASLRAERSAEASVQPSSSRDLGPTPSGNSLTTVHVRDLRPGDCWTTDSWEPNEQGNVTRIHCGLRHQFEVVWTGTYSSDTYPSTEGELLTYIDTQCSPAFTDYVGVPWTDSPYDVWWTYPTADRWVDGDRSLVCSAFDVDGPIAHSIKDIMRP
jgi:hypothetical protein